MRNYKMTVAYDGTRYQGWQRQADTDLTVQGILEQAVSACIGYRTEIDGSGRTDGGVHASGQVANVKTSGKLDERRFREQLNALLPEDIRIRKVELVKNSFHSRLSAKAKRYEYVIDGRERPDVFTRKYCWHYTKPLSVERMRKAADYLTGTHDFGGFTDQKDERSTVRTIYEIAITSEGEKIRFSFYGNGFMYHMVRILVGTLIEAGNGEREPDSILDIIESKKRAEAGFLAPAHGLCLKEVFYRQDFSQRPEAPHGRTSPVSDTGSPIS